jgi:hypothetical protein
MREMIAPGVWSENVPSSATRQGHRFEPMGGTFIVPHAPVVRKDVLRDDKGEFAKRPHRKHP